MKLGQKVLGKKLFGLMMKQTFYGHFVAGEDQERIKPTIGRMQRWGFFKNTNSAKVEISLVSDPVWTCCNFLALAWNQSWTTLLRLTRPMTPRRRRRSPGRSRRWAWDSEIVSILEVWSAFFFNGLSLPSTRKWNILFCRYLPVFSVQGHKRVSPLSMNECPSD